MKNFKNIHKEIGPLRYQAGESDCVPTTIVNALMFLTSKNLNPALQRLIWSASLDSGKQGTGWVGCKLLAEVLQSWFDFAKHDEYETSAANLAFESYVFSAFDASELSNFASESLQKIDYCLSKGGVVCLTAGKGTHYQLIHSKLNGEYLGFDSDWTKSDKNRMGSAEIEKYSNMANIKYDENTLKKILKQKANQWIHIIQPKKLKIALVQLDAEDPLWGVDSTSKLLSQCGNCDLVVFPECYHFDNYKNCITLEKEKSMLEKIKLPSGEAVPNFMAGGYVLDDAGKKRNVALLVEKGKVVGHYFKRVAWDEDIEVGACATKFNLTNFSFVPLICADAGQPEEDTSCPHPQEAKNLGASKDTPIIMISYGAGFKEQYWKAPLQVWSKETNAPLIVCAVSGHGKEFIDKHDNKKGNYGGGGSAVFWPDGTNTPQTDKRGIFVVDLYSRNDPEFIKIKG